MMTALGILCGFFSVWAWFLARIAARETPLLTHRELNDYATKQEWHKQPL